MARPAIHSPEAILDAARDLLLSGGPRATSVAAIAAASGAPVGTLYHRFGSRDELLAAVWLRSLARFQASYLAAEDEHEDPVRRGAAMAAAVVRFARTEPADAQMLLATRGLDLLDGDASGTTSAALRERIAATNAPLDAAIARLARARFGRADRRAVERVRLAVVDLPVGTLRRYVDATTAIPPWVEAEVADAAARILA